MIGHNSVLQVIAIPKIPIFPQGSANHCYSSYQEAAEAEVSGLLLAEAQSAFDDSLDQAFSLTVDPGDAQTLLFAYPSLSRDFDGYVKPAVRFEFGARGVHLPADVRKIIPYVHQAFPDLPGSGEINVKTLGVERTFWEKATILRMLYHRDPAKALAERMSRHYYDMARLIGHEAKACALGRLDLLEQVAQHKSVFFKASWAKYENAKPGSLRLMPNADLSAALRRDCAASARSAP